MNTRTLTPLLLLAACFDQNLGSTADSGMDALASAGHCDPAADAGIPPQFDASPSGGYSNGVTAAVGVDPDLVTTIDGICSIDADVGTIDCEGLALRSNVPGVFNNIGYERRAPIAPNCAGSSVAAPGIGVFSFGSLVMAPGARLHFRGSRAVALVALRSLSFSGDLSVYGENGGFVIDDFFANGIPPGVGPAGGASISNVLEGSMGAPGGGGLGIGGAGGNCGRETAAVVPQFEPLCGGSSGGVVGHAYPEGGFAIFGGAGGGGGALLLAAGEAISVTGTDGCGIHANGNGGWGSELGGGGGGAGGTILIEAPVVDLGECWVTANGGGGGGGGFDGQQTYPGAPGGPTGAAAPGGGDIDRGGSGGALASAASNGASGSFGGGGGGAAGFIRIRTADCDTLPATISPRPTCETLVP